MRTRPPPGPLPATPRRAAEIAFRPVRKEGRKEIPMKPFAIVALSLALQAAFLLQVSLV